MITCMGWISDTMECSNSMHSQCYYFALSDHVISEAEMAGISYEYIAEPELCDMLGGS